MDAILTLTEIRKQFPSEWVLLESPQTNELRQIVNGKVLYHSADRDEVYRQAATLKPRRSAILFTGNLPPPLTAMVL